MDFIIVRLSSELRGINHWNILHTGRIPIKERKIAAVTAVSSTLFSFAWHTSWHSLTQRLFKRSSTDINTFERLTWVRFSSLCARNMRLVALAGGIALEGKPDRHEDCFGFTIGTSILNERSPTPFPHKYSFPLQTKVFDGIHIFVTNMHTVTIIFAVTDPWKINWSFFSNYCSMLLAAKHAEQLYNCTRFLIFL